MLEGIMMKNQDLYAVAVRKPDQEIEVDVKHYQGIASGNTFAKIPFVRGVFNFIDSLILGMRTLMYSASFFEEEEEAQAKKNMTEAQRLKEEKKGAAFYDGGDDPVGVSGAGIIYGSSRLDQQVPAGTTHEFQICSDGTGGSGKTPDFSGISRRWFPERKISRELLCIMVRRQMYQLHRTWDGAYGGKCKEKFQTA